MSSKEPTLHESTVRARREAWLQIYLPVIFVALLAIGAVVWLGIGGSMADASALADFSLTLTILPACVLGVFALAALVALTVGVARLVQGIPPYTGKIQRFANRVYKGVDRVTNRLAGVIIAIRSFLAGLEALLTKRPEKES